MSSTSACASVLSGVCAPASLKQSLNIPKAYLLAGIRIIRGMCPGLIEAVAETWNRTSVSVQVSIIRGMCPGLIEAVRVVSYRQSPASELVLSGVCAPGLIEASPDERRPGPWCRCPVLSGVCAPASLKLDSLEALVDGVSCRRIIRGMCPGLIEAPGRQGTLFEDSGGRYYPGYVPRPH